MEDQKWSSDDRYQAVGLAGFVLSGVIFLIAGIRAGDALTIAGSLAWTLSCVVWAIPSFRRR
jgi:hypothetical protein